MKNTKSNDVYRSEINRLFESQSDHTVCHFDTDPCCDETDVCAVVCGRCGKIHIYCSRFNRSAILSFKDELIL